MKTSQLFMAALAALVLTMRSPQLAAAGCRNMGSNGMAKMPETGKGVEMA